MYLKRVSLQTLRDSGNVVLDSLKRTFMHENDILDQKCQCSLFSMKKILIFASLNVTVIVTFRYFQGVFEKKRKKKTYISIYVRHYRFVAQALLGKPLEPLKPMPWTKEKKITPYDIGSYILSLHTQQIENDYIFFLFLSSKYII